MIKRFLERFPSATRAAWLSEKRLGAWLRANGSSGRKTPGELFTRLDRAAHGIADDEGDTRGAVTLAFVAVLKSLRTQIDELETRIAELLDAHPDAPIFQSLRRSGTIREATLLAEIDDCRARFPDPESLACLAGVAASTRASDRHHTVTFRWAAEKKLRDALCDFAGDSWRANAWAQARYR
jgi:transposase